MPSLTRRRFLASLTAATLATPRVARAAEESAVLDIDVDKGPWGSASPADVRTVALAAAGEVWQFCAGQRLKPIRIYHRDDFPQTDFLHDWHGRIRIGLKSGDTRFPQMAFQFGHEFCHALAQHSEIAKRGWHPPRHANLWFEESLCETSSLFVLRRLAITWQQHAPAEMWRGYVPAMEAYAAERLARPEHQLPEGTTFAAWFRQNEPALRENPALRAKNVIIARQMLPLFETQPAAWQCAAYLNLGTHQQGKPLAQHLAEWQNNSPAGMRPLLGKIAGLFGISG